MTQFTHYPPHGDLGQKTMAESQPVVIASDQTPIPVTVVSGGSGTQVDTYSEALAVASNIVTTITTYIVPVGKTAFLERISFSGGNIALYRTLVNGVNVDTRQTYFGGELCNSFEFNGSSDGLGLVAGDQVQITVVHQRPTVADFYARIQVTEK